MGEYKLDIGLGTLIFGGIIATISYGILIMKYSTRIPEKVGIYMILSIPIIVILAVIGFPSRIFYEWVFLFTIYSWIILCSYFLLKNSNKE